MILLIDNYDSFSYNLVHFLGELGAEIAVRRNDALTVDEALAMAPEAVVLSPGPGRPESAGICLELLAHLPDDMPVLGVCLGHQAIAQSCGAEIVQASELMHGKTSPVRHDGQGLFDGIPDGFEATRYHSLTVAPESMPACLEKTAHTDKGLLMALQGRDRPLFGVQFHPESIASEHGHALLGNFLKQVGRRQ